MYVLVGGPKDFRCRAKRKDRREFGLKYTDFILNCLRERAGAEVDNEIVFDDFSPVDFVWDSLNLGMECKRLFKTRFMNDGFARAWLRQEVLSRFADCERETGTALKTRILCVTEKKWSGKVDSWLGELGYKVIETGQINTRLQRLEAGSMFIDAFTDIVEETCRRCGE